MFPQVLSESFEQTSKMIYINKTDMYHKITRIGKPDSFFRIRYEIEAIAVHISP